MDPSDLEKADSLVYASTWAVASVCFVLIVCSLTVERTIFAIGQFWNRRKQFALSEALEKIKQELMVVGFISLALAVGTSHVAKICVPKSWKKFFPQCRLPTELEESESTSPDRCSAAKPGKADFIHSESLHQLHILIFSLAIVHVVYSVLTMALGMWKVHLWKRWENIASETEIASSHGGLRYTKDATFIKRHVDGIWSKNIFLSYIAAFFHQFYKAVSSTDYLTLRHGFLVDRGLQNFDFHTYMMRSLEKDFKHVVGISLPLWGYMVLLLLLNVEGWGMLYWSSLIPFIMVLAVGTKLQLIITKMAIHCLDKHAVIEGMPAVKPSDDLFWFGRPRLILSLIHFILFQDALEVAVHLWSTFTFTKTNCFNRTHYLIALRLIIGLISQVLCGYVVLPIYAIVSQMGSQMKKHDGMELGHVLREEGEGSISVAAVNELRGADGGGEGSIDDSQDRLQRRMSYIERVARGIPISGAEPYHKLNPPTPR